MILGIQADSLIHTTSEIVLSDQTTLLVIRAFQSAQTAQVVSDEWFAFSCTIAAVSSAQVFYRMIQSKLLTVMADLVVKQKDIT